VGPAFLEEREEFATAAPHLSYSRINRYLTCPEQYRLYYVENLRPRFASANLVFGQIVHQALAHLFRSEGDPVQFFLDQWKLAGGYDLSYGQRDSWEKLQGTGQALLDRFVRQEAQRVGKISGIEKTFELAITTLDLPLVGIIDLVAEVDGKRTVVDFKTSASAYQDHEVILSDQLPAYQLAEPAAEQAALCVFVKTKEPQIEWHLSRRTGEQMGEFLDKADLIAHEIASAHFYKRPGKWCAWCDYLPLCTADKQKAEETLIRIQ
jgi:putative RecB family exonuclease